MAMTPEALGSLRRLASFLEENQGRLVIDADTHATDLASLTGPARQRYESESGYYHGRPVSAEDLLLEMQTAAVDMALIWQNPATTAYTNDPERNAEALLAANRYIRDAAERYPNKFIPAGWTDPKACGLASAVRMAEVFVCEFGFPIVKMNPAQNRYPIDSPEVLRVVDRIVELGAVPAFHFGADTPFTPAEGLEAVSLRHPGYPLLAVHMGGGGAGYLEAEALYQKARELGLRRPNIRYILSAKRDPHMESDFIAYRRAGPPYSGNLFCGSDAPYGRLSWNFGGFRAMLQSLMDAESAQAYLGGNFARFVLAACRKLLAAQSPSEAA